MRIENEVNLHHSTSDRDVKLAPRVWKHFSSTEIIKIKRHVEECVRNVLTNTSVLMLFYSFLMAATAFLAASSRFSAAVMGRPLSVRILLASVTLVPVRKKTMAGEKKNLLQTGRTDRE